MLYVYEVGKPYPGASLGMHGAHLRLEPEGAELTIFVPSPTPEEIYAVRRGEVQFAWLELKQECLLLTNFQAGVIWQESPYSPHRILNAGQQWHLPDLKPGHHMLLRIFLIDLDTHLLKAIRQTTWNYFFVSSAKRAIERILTKDFDNELAVLQLEALFQAYPMNSNPGRTVQRMLRDLATATCRGGAQNEDLGLYTAGGSL